MALQDLPVEILCTVIRFVSSKQLRKQEACCLLVCKRWYTLAEPILLEDLVLSARQFTQLPDQVHAKLRTFSRTLTFHVHGPNDWPAEESLEQLNEKFNSCLLRCSRLVSFTLLVRTQFDPAQPMAPHNDYLSLWSPARFLDAFGVCKLSELVLDTCGSEFKDGVHVCPQLALKIPTLRTVRLRMRRICPQVLNLQQRDCALPTRIESIIINLSLKEADRFSAGYSRHCTESRRALELYDGMVAAAIDTAKQTSSLKVLRVLSHKHPSLEMVAKDCLAGAKVILSDEGDWDWADNGCADPDEEEISDQDLFLTDSNSDGGSTVSGMNGDVI